MITAENIKQAIKSAERFIRSAKSVPGKGETVKELENILQVLNDLTGLGGKQ